MLIIYNYDLKVYKKCFSVITYKVMYYLWSKNRIIMRNNAPTAFVYYI